MKDITLVSHLQSLASQGAKGAQASSEDFGQFLEEAVSEVNQQQLNADKAVEQLQTGEASNLHEVMVAMEKADISLRLMVQMRNKVVEAYQEIMRMQV